MKLKSEQLKQHLTSNLLQVYLISGDEPLLVQETCDQIRAAANKKDFLDRELFHGEKGDVDAFSLASDSLSLFAEQKIYEFRFNKLPGVDFCKCFVKWAENPSPDQFLLISCAKLDKKATNKDWYKALEKLGAHITIWPIDAKRLPGWIAARARKHGLALETDALSVLAQRVEGNLLAAEQEIQRLSLLYSKSDSITAAMMKDYVGDNARYDSFELLEASLSGDAKRLTRILHGLKLEGEAVARINALLTFELRTITKMSWDCQQGEMPASVMQKNYVWANKKDGYGKSLARYNVRVWQRLLARCLELDKIIKGQQSGDAWTALESLLLQVSGNSLWKAR